jgi:aryl-alcohol dehydrogenase-like predicted oxidoreductase
MEGTLAEAWTAWRDRYLTDLQKLLDEIRRRVSEKTRERTIKVAEAIDPHLPADRRGEPLSRKALWVAASTPGVSCVLVGMRRPQYVNDALGILPWPPLPEVIPVYEAVKSLTIG